MMLGMLQNNSRAFRNLASQSRQSRGYHPQLVAVYHPSENEYISLSGEYLIKLQARCTLTRDEIQGRLAALDDMHRTLCGDVRSEATE